jgi:hypothetical protein
MPQPSTVTTWVKFLNELIGAIQNGCQRGIIMPQPSTVTTWVKFLNELIGAIQNGQVAVQSLEGKTLPEMAAISEQGWDNFDAAIAEAKASDNPS